MRIIHPPCDGFGSGLPGPKLQTIFGLLLASLVMPAWAVDTVLHNSVKEVSTALQVGPRDPHAPSITRTALRPDERGAAMEFEVVLKMRNFDELQQRINKGEIISPAEMADKYDPTAADEQAVVDWLTGEGLTLVRRDNNRLAIFVRGTVSEVAHALQVNFARVAFEGGEYTSAVSAPSVPSTIAPVLVAINGLQPHLRAHKHPLKPATLYSTGAPFLPRQIAHAYNADALYADHVTGAGQTIAVVIDNFPAASDLTTYWQTYGVGQSINNISFIQVVTGALSADNTEATLDVEWSSSIAPGAQVRVYGTKDLAYHDTDVAYQQIYADAATYGIHQVSISYSLGETYTSPGQFTTEKQYFANLASAGVTVFAASGDGGATPDSNGGATGPTQVSYPASDPNVTAVGGTTLTDSSNTPLESGWSLGGGGYSSKFAVPSWQPANGRSARTVPDVSCDGDPNDGGVVILNGTQTAFGGTSLSTPIWAGLSALINQSRASASPVLSSIGLLGPHIYPLAGTSAFRDITTGNNGYAAGTGYDLVTGLGVPETFNLAQALAPGWLSSPVSILHNFGDGSVTGDGVNAGSGLIQARDGNFYGVAPGNSGVLYKITPQGVTSIVYTFGASAQDGAGPEGPLVQGTDGAFYGATNGGGTAQRGTVFKITAQGVETILHNFGDQSVANDGGYPSTGLIRAADGNFYGCTESGGSASAGTLYKITPQGAVTILHSAGNGDTLNNGGYFSTLVQGTDGNFYGTTREGGTGSNGTVFQMTGQGAITILHSFNDGSVVSDGALPEAALIQGTDGNFYGTTNSGGAGGRGSIFQMTSQGAVTILHSFGDLGDVTNEGTEPQGPLVQGTDGNFYGTASAGGTTGEYGIIYELTAQGQYSIRHNFGDGTVPNDGENSTAGLVQGTDGNFYGTTPAGGSNFEGTVYELLSKQAAVITSPGVATFTIGLACSFTVTATGTPAPSLSERGLPSWATFNTTTGVISGTPPSNAAATYAVIVSASNGSGACAVQALTLNVQTVSQLIAPAITSSPLAVSIPAGMAYSFSYQATGAPAPSFTLASGALPTGLSLSSAGAISGTPIEAGTFTGSVRASNGVGTAATQNFTITVQRVPLFVGGPPTSPVAAGTAYSYSFTAVGPPASTFALTSGTLPTGLTLTSAGLLAGTPTQGGLFNFTVTATNAVGATAGNFSIVVQSPPAFTSAPVNATILVDSSYSFTYQTSGYPTPTLTVSAGALPSEIFLNGTTISGTAFYGGTYTGTITASNGAGPDVTQNFTFVVGSPPTLSYSSIQQTIPINTYAGFTFGLSYGYPTPTITLVSGTIPPGMTLSTSGSSPGEILGTPTTAGTYSGTISFSNAFGPPLTATFTFVVAAPAAPAFTNGPPPSGTVGLSYNFTYLTSGYPAPSFSVTSGSLPPGVNLSSAGLISGSPSQTGTYSGTVTAYNGTSPNATQAFSIVIGPAPNIAYAIIHHFQDNSVTNDGKIPGFGLTAGSDGNLYGVTSTGGSQNLGVAFKITPQGAVTILHNFHDGTVAQDGSNPSGPLVLGADGNFYGTTSSGGGGIAEGVIFKLTPQGTETIVHVFGDGSVSPDGDQPFGGLSLGSDGNFYGTTVSGGTAFDGTVYKLTPQGVETVLHSFGDGSVAPDGLEPQTAPVRGTDGNLYGVTSFGGSASKGTIYKITSAGVTTILHHFGDGSVTNDGTMPSMLTQGPGGILYGVTKLGGTTSGYGLYYKIDASGTMTVLHRFGDGTVPNDALEPAAPLILGTDGNFYGTSFYGGVPGYGSIFEATPQGGIAILHSLNNGTPPNDGGNPTARLVLGTDGNFYGTTQYGGTAGDGIVFQLSVTAVVSAPSITSATSATFTVGHANSFTFTAAGSPTPTLSATGLPAWAIFNPATGVLIGAPPSTAGAPYTITVTASNGPSSSASQAFTLNVQAATAVLFSQWESGFTNPISSGLSATPQGDGVPNAFKYVFDINPGESMSAADRAALPVFAADLVGGREYLSLTYRQYQSLDPSMAVQVQTSTDMQTWSTLTQSTTTTATTTSYTMQEVNSDPTTHDPIMQVRLPASGAKEFIRLSVPTP